MSDRIAFSGKVEADGRRIKGSVVLKGSRTDRGTEWLEIDPAALVKADARDVFALLNHEENKVLGRTKNGTLSIHRDEDGISFETAELPNTQAANDALELARGGYFGGSSFTIEVKRSHLSTAEDGRRLRRITSIGRLTDVSPVYDPAFSNSSASAFSKERTMAAQETNPPEEPTPPEEPEGAKRKPVVKLAAEKQTGAERWEEFARDISTEQIEATLDNLMVEFKGNLKGEEADRYEGFAKELQRRKRDDAETKARVEAMQFKHMAIRGLVKAAPETEVYASRDYEEAFWRVVRSTPQTISANLVNMEQFAQTVAGDGSQGGFMVPDGFLVKLGERLKAFGGIASISQEITTSTGESLRWPYIDDTANKAAIASEDTQVASGADLVFDSIELGAFEYDASGASGNPIEVSLTLLQDASFDVEGLLARLLSTRIGRKQADHFATGTGVNEPVGLLSKTADTMTATVVSLAAPEHIFQVDRAYRDNARWVMSDTTLAKLWTSQATTNEPMFQPGRTLNGKPFDVLFGYPISIDNSAGNLVAFGDIEAGYIVRRVRGVQLLVDPYTAQKKRAVQYHAWARADANIQDPNAYSVSTWASVTADT